MKKRIEADSIGSMEVPEKAYYGVQALRAKENFKITGNRMSPEFLNNLALIKKAAAIVNYEAGLLEYDKAKAIRTAAAEVMNGKFDDEFIVDAVQGGARAAGKYVYQESAAGRWADR